MYFKMYFISLYGKAEFLSSVSHDPTFLIINLFVENDAFSRLFDK